MRLLAFDTSTDAMSIALSVPDGDGRRCWEHTAPGGARASAALIPVIMDLMRQAGIDFPSLEAIAFGRGPGAFTGLRTACAVAQGLAFGARGGAGGAGPSVLPVDTLLAVAEEARLRHAPGGQPLHVLALLDARMDQVYAGAYAYDGAQWRGLRAPALLQPEEILAEGTWPGADAVAAGNVFGLHGTRLGLPADMARVEALPTAAALLRLAPSLLAAGYGVAPEHALPLYIRDKVAQTTSERAAARAGLAHCP